MTIGGRKMLLLPWICDDNRSDALDMIKKSKASYCMGHLELKGFQPIAGFTMDHGTKLTCLVNSNWFALVTTIYQVVKTR